jgi:hypothetical protein
MRPSCSGNNASSSWILPERIDGNNGYIHLLVSHFWTQWTGNPADYRPVSNQSLSFWDSVRLRKGTGLWDNNGYQKRIAVERKMTLSKSEGFHDKSSADHGQSYFFRVFLLFLIRFNFNRHIQGMGSTHFVDTNFQSDLEFIQIRGWVLWTSLSSGLCQSFRTTWKNKLIKCDCQSIIEVKLLLDSTLQNPSTKKLNSRPTFHEWVMDFVLIIRPISHIWRLGQSRDSHELQPRR